MEKESIFSVCKAVCVERKWARGVTMMFIPRPRLTRSCFSGGRTAGFMALCFHAGAVWMYERVPSMSVNYAAGLLQ